MNNQRYNSKYTKLILSFPRVGCRGAGIPPAAARQHQDVPIWPQQQIGTGLRNAQIRIWIRIAGRTTSRVLFRSRPWTKRVRPSWPPSF